MALYLYSTPVGDTDADLSNGFSVAFSGDSVTISRTDGASFDANNLIENIFIYSALERTPFQFDYRQDARELIVTQGSAGNFGVYADWEENSGAPATVTLQSITDTAGSVSTINDVSTVSLVRTSSSNIAVIDTARSDNFTTITGRIGSINENNDPGVQPYRLSAFTNHIENAPVTIYETGLNARTNAGEQMYQITGKYGTLRIASLGIEPYYEFIPNAQAINALETNSQETFILTQDVTSVGGGLAQQISFTVLLTGVNDAPVITVDTLSPIYEGNAQPDEWETLFDNNAVLDAVDENQRVRGVQIEINNIQHGADEKIKLGQWPVELALNTSHSGTTQDGLSYSVALENRTQNVKTRDGNGNIIIQEQVVQVAVITLDRQSGLTADDIASLEYQHLGNSLNGDRAYSIVRANESISSTNELLSDWFEMDIHGTIVDFSFMIEDVNVFITDNPGADLFGTIEGNLAAGTGQYSYQLLDTVIDGTTYRVGTAVREGVTYQTLNSPYGMLLVDPETGAYMLDLNSQAINDIETGTPDENQVSFNVSVRDPNNPRYGSAEFNVNVKVDASPEAGALYVEQDTPDTLLEGISLYSTRENEFDVRYFDISIPGNDPNVNLLVPNAPVIDTTKDAISFQDNKVFLGLGEGRFLQIGRVDTQFNGQNGNTLRIIMEQQVINGDFSEYTQYVAPTVTNNGIEDVGTQPIFNGWTVTSLRDVHPHNGGSVPSIWIPGQTTIEIDGRLYQTPLYDNNGPENYYTNEPLPSDSPIRAQNMAERNRVYVLPTEMGINLNFDSPSDGSAQISRFAYMVSEPVAITEGSTISFDYYVGAPAGGADLLAYMVNLDTGEWTEVENYSGSFDEGLWSGYLGTLTVRPAESAFITASVKAPTSGRYAIVMAAGAYEDLGGFSEHADIYIKDVKVTGTASMADNSMVQRVIEEIRYQNTSDLTAENTLLDKSLTINVQNFDGSSDEVTMDFEIREVNDAPVATNPNQIVDVTDTVNWDTPSVSGSFNIIDPDENTQMRFYSVDNNGNELVDNEGYPEPLVGRYGTLSFGGEGAGWTYTIDPFAFNSLLDGQVVNENFANLQGTDGDGGIVNLTLTFRLAGEADQTVFTFTDTSSDDTFTTQTKTNAFGSLAQQGFEFSMVEGQWGSHGRYIPNA